MKIKCGKDGVKIYTTNNLVQKYKLKGRSRKLNPENVLKAQLRQVSNIKKLDMSDVALDIDTESNI